MKKEVIISFIGLWLLRALGLTLRIRIKDQAGYFTRPLKSPLIFVFWHNRIAVMPIFFLRFYRHHKGCAVLTSPSRDGTLLAEFMNRLGAGVVRGSSSRRGMRALLELRDSLKKGLDVFITPDGPRGPRYKLSAGVILLAQKSSVPVMPLTIEYSRYAELKSWDKFRIPMPFSRVDITLGELHSILPVETNEEFETLRLNLEKLMQSSLSSM